MRVLFCSDPFEHAQPDSAYLQEAEAAHRVGLEYGLISFEALVDEQNAAKAVRRIGAAEEQEEAIYRGWMLTPEQYTELYNALLTRNVKLINDPAAYRHCHYLPESFAEIMEHTPRTVWLPESEGLTSENVQRALKTFGEQAIIVKDYVKSRKHDWLEACYIPSASDTEAAERVINRFIELQGDDLQGGLVLREFVDLEPIATHSKSGMPLTKEYRVFFMDSEPLFWTNYWEEGDYGDERPDVKLFSKVAAKVRSRFFTMDIAKQRIGGWVIVELGDGQVAGLPENADVPRFYAALSERSSAQ